MKHCFMSLVLIALLMSCSSQPDPFLIYHTDWFRTDDDGLWRTMPDGSNTARISTSGWFAEYSPDNTQIAYSEPYDDGIWIMDVDGKGLVQLTSFGSAPSWSPDGSRLAFNIGGAKGADRWIWIMNADGTDAHQLSSVNGSFPHWSSDGTRIIFHGEVNSGIWLIDPDGENETLLYRYGGYPAWSPDGKQIAYVHLSDWCIWVMDVNGENHRKLTDHSGFDPAWSADGSQIAYDGMEEKKSVIFVINQDGSDDHMIEKGGSHPDWPN